MIEMPSVKAAVVDRTFIGRLKCFWGIRSDARAQFVITEIKSNIAALQNLFAVQQNGNPSFLIVGFPIPGYKMPDSPLKS